MAMVASDLRDAIVSAFDNVTSSYGDNPENAIADDYTSELDSTIKGYIEDNCEINYSWVALMPPPVNTPDPTTSFAASVSFASFTIGTQPDLTTWGLTCASQVIAGTISPNDPTFSLPPMTFLPNPSLVIAQSGADNYNDSLLSLANDIINWIKTLINPTPFPGTHLVYTVPSPGAIMTSIS